VGKEGSVERDKRARQERESGEERL